MGGHKKSDKLRTYACVCVSLSIVSNSVVPWTIAHQDPLPMEFSREECWSWLPFPPPGVLPNPGIELQSPALQEEKLDICVVRRGGFRYALIGGFGIQEPGESSLVVGILCDSLQEQVWLSLLSPKLNEKAKIGESSYYWWVLAALDLKPQGFGFLGCFLQSMSQSYIYLDYCQLVYSVSQLLAKRWWWEKMIGNKGTKRNFPYLNCGVFAHMHMCLLKS